MTDMWTVHINETQVSTARCQTTWAKYLTHEVSTYLRPRCLLLDVITTGPQGSSTDL